MSKQKTIYEMKGAGATDAAIAAVLGIDPKTVRKYRTQDDFSPELPLRVKRASKLDPYKSVIDGWLQGDRDVFRKQRHTAARIQERLKDEHGLSCGITIIQEYLKEKKEEMQCSLGSLDLAWGPGYAQVDFGDVDVILCEALVRANMLAISFPQSNMGYCQLFLGETAECVCQGLMDIFAHIGGIPHTIIFDNATGIGKRICGIISETELFSRFKMHHRFQARFCNPNAGNEKGSVERKVPYLRRSKLFVPIPALNDIDAFNAELLKGCAFQESKPHYKWNVLQGELFEKDCAALLSLPPKPFNVCRYVECVSDGYGHVTLDGRHTYSTCPEHARRKTICAIRATRVEFISEEGEVLSSHRREFGKKKTESVDPASQLRLLSKRPGGWRNSRIRADIPPGVVAHLDSLEKDELRRSLRLLYEASCRSGLEATLEALDLLQKRRDRTPDFFDVGVLAARIADYGIDTAPEAGADLNCYDRYFLSGGTHAIPCTN